MGGGGAANHPMGAGALRVSAILEALKGIEMLFLKV